MKKGERKKQEIIEKTAQYMLEHGLQNASLRSIAQEAGTSDRMLLHYFKDKEELVTVVLTYIAEKLIHMLEHAEIEKASFSSLIRYLYNMMKDPEVGPIMKLWLEIVAVASKKEDPYYSVAKEICEGFYGFYLRVLKIEDIESKEKIASLALVIVEGIALLEGIGEDEKIERAITGMSVFDEKLV